MTIEIKTKDEQGTRTVTTGDRVYCRMHGREVLIRRIESDGMVEVGTRDLARRLPDLTHRVHLRAI